MKEVTTVLFALFTLGVDMQ